MSDKNINYFKSPVAIGAMVFILAFYVGFTIGMPWLWWLWTLILMGFVALFWFGRKIR